MSLAGARIKPSGKAEFTVDTKKYSITLRMESDDVKVAVGEKVLFFLSFCVVVV